MPETLFGQSAQLLEAAGQKQTQEGAQEAKAEEIGARAGEAASSEIGADRRQKAGAMDAQKLQAIKGQMDQAENMVTLTPQLALGMVKNTGDKEWMKAIGQKMRADVMMSFYTHGIKTEQAKKAPHVTQIYDENGKVRHAVVYTDEDGNTQQLTLDAGMTPDQLNKGKGGKGKGGKEDDTDFKKNKVFLSEYDRRKAEYSDPIKAKEAQDADPAKYAEDIQWLKDKRDKYDKITSAMGDVGAGAEGKGGGGAGGGKSSDNAPFDADAFIKDALSQ